MIKHGYQNREMADEIIALFDGLAGEPVGTVTSIFDGKFERHVEIGRLCMGDNLYVYAPLAGPELELARQWFDCCQDTAGAGFLKVEDYKLAEWIYKRLGMRVPNSITKGASNK